MDTPLPLASVCTLEVAEGASTEVHLGELLGDPQGDPDHRRALLTCRTRPTATPVTAGQARPGAGYDA